MDIKSRQEGTDKVEHVNGSVNDNVNERDNDDSKKKSPVPALDTNNVSYKNDPLTQVADDDDEEDVDISCGIWRLRTKFFGKCFSNLYVFAICVGVAGLFTTMVSEIIQVQLTSLERQFNIDNAHAGLLDTAFKAGYLTTIILAGHFTKKAHIPLIIGLSGVIQGLILLVPPILQFADPYELPDISDDNSSQGSENKNYICALSDSNTNHSGTNTTLQAKEVNRLAYNILILLQTMKGVTDVFHAGFLPAIYMDDNLLDKSKMGILLGIQNVLVMLSGPLGREINGIISNIPIDLKKTEINPDDHRFVAAWWLGFLIFGIGTILFSFLVMLFPRRLVSKRQRKKAAEKTFVSFSGGQVEEEIEVVVLEETSKESPNRKRSSLAIMDTDANINKGSTKSAPEIQKSSRRQSVATNSNESRRRSSLFPPLAGPTERKVSLTGDIVISQSVSVASEENNNEKTSTTLELLKDFPRAMYRMFRRPIFLLLILDVVLASVPAGGMSFFRSTYMANEYNVPMSRVAFLSGISSSIGNVGGSIVSSLLSSRVTTKVGYVLIIFFAYLIATCMTPLYIVFGCDNVPVYGAPGEIGLPINSSGICGCDSVGQLLSCGNDNNNYFSPCMAGCTGTHGNVFSNCSFLSNNTIGTSLSPGLCSTDCNRNFLIYVFVHGLQNFVTASAGIAYRLLILRSVEPRDRGLSMSLYDFFFLLLGIPAPSLFGRVVDGACYIKDGDYCALYDRNSIRYFMSGIDVALHASSQLTSLMILSYFKWEERQIKRKAKTLTDEGLNSATKKPEEVESENRSNKVMKISDVSNGVSTISTSL